MTAHSLTSYLHNEVPLEEALESLLQEGPLAAYAVYKVGKKAIQNQDKIKKAVQTGVQVYHTAKEEHEKQKKRIADLEAKKAELEAQDRAKRQRTYHPPEHGDYYGY